MRCNQNMIYSKITFSCLVVAAEAHFNCKYNKCKSRWEWKRNKWNEWWKRKRHHKKRKFPFLLWTKLLLTLWQHFRIKRISDTWCGCSECFDTAEMIASNFRLLSTLQSSPRHSAVVAFNNFRVLEWQQRMEVCNWNNIYIWEAVAGWPDENKIENFWDKLVLFELLSSHEDFSFRRCHPTAAAANVFHLLLGISLSLWFFS